MNTYPDEPRDPHEVLPRTIKLLGKWMVRLGFSGYQVTVLVLERENYGKCWAASTWSTDDESVTFRFMPDGTLPKDTQELVIIHEVAHGLMELATEHGMTNLEQACWKIARSFRPEALSPAQWTEPAVAFMEESDCNG